MSEIPLTIINIDQSNSPVLADIMTQSFELYENEAPTWRSAEEQFRRRGEEAPTQPLPSQIGIPYRLSKDYFSEENNRVTEELSIVERSILVGKVVNRVVSLADTPDLKLKRYIPVIYEAEDSFVIQPLNLIYGVEMSKERQGGHKDGLREIRYRFEFNHEGFRYRQYPPSEEVTNSRWEDLEEYELKDFSPIERLRFFMGSLCKPAQVDYDSISRVRKDRESTAS